MASLITLLIRFEQGHFERIAPAYIFAIHTQYIISLKMKKVAISALLILVVGLVLSSCKTGQDCPAYRSHGQVQGEKMN